MNYKTVEVYHNVERLPDHYHLTDKTAQFDVEQADLCLSYLQIVHWSTFKNRLYTPVFIKQSL